MIKKLYKKLLLLSVYICGIVCASEAQISISGSNCIASTTNSYTYTLSGSSYQGSDDIAWTLYGGVFTGTTNTSISGTISSIGVQVNVTWSLTQGAYIEIYSSQLGTFRKNINHINTSITPASQLVNYDSPASIYPVSASGGSCSITYVWQLALSPTGPFSDIPGATYPYYTHSSITQLTYFRRITNIDGIGSYSNLASASVASFSAGTISITSPVNYNTVALVNQSPAIGNCNAANYQYQWEHSVENGPWIAVGTGFNYPASAPAIIGKTAIRRKVTCNDESLYSNTLIIEPVYTTVNFENRNYVRENAVFKPGIKSWQQSDLLPRTDKQQSTTYLDGFGRTIQVVAKESGGVVHGVAKDIVKHYDYDAAGRMTKDFIPYVTTDYSGKFKPDAATEQPGYFDNNFNDAVSYSLIEYDNSPLNRVMKTTAPGAVWVGTNVSIKNDFNKEVEKVHQWNLDYSGSALPATSPTLVYPTGTLARDVSKDEKNNKVITYTDLNGNIILKKVQEDADPLGEEHDGWVCTYYAYDDFGRLRYIITPKAVKYLDHHGWNMNQILADELCYQYNYDEKGRVVVKKQPGTGPLKMVYDTRDRLVFTQDANMAIKNQWMASLYDALDRVAVTGLLTYTGDRSSLQQIVTQQTTTPSNPNSGLQEDLLIEVFTSGTYNAIRSITLASGFETVGGTGVEFTAQISMDPGGADGESFVMEDLILNKNPIPTGAQFLTLSITYYDNYQYAGVKLFNSTYTLESYEPNIETITITNRTTGMVTGEKTRVLDGDNNSANDKFLFATAYYDEKGRSIENLVDNIKDATDYQVMQYDFSGKVTSKYNSHSNGSSTFTIRDLYDYDKTGRLVVHRKTYNSNLSKLIAEYLYDELGNLKTKRLAPGYTATGKNEIERLDYEYNIQGWLTGINKNYARGDNNYSQWDNYFGMHIGYDNSMGQFDAAQYNGSITGIAWRSQGDNTPRKFDFTYDRLDRLTSAVFKQKKKPSESAWSNTEVDFSTYIQYEDGNGNIKSMEHTGIIPGVNNGVIIDNLQYSYLPTGIAGLNGNKLQKVEDQGTLSATNQGLLGDFKDVNNTQDYYYDENGNLVKDLNKGIKNGSSDGITYNFLNKPEKIVVDGKSIIEFTYDASGQKLKKQVTYPNSSKRITTYIGDYVYEEYIPFPVSGLHGEELQYVLHEEGRLKIITPHVKANDNDYELNAGNPDHIWPGGKQAVFEYFIKDHLGNTRMVLTEEVQKEYYLAKMEQNLYAQEEPLFGKVNANGTTSTDNELFKTRLPNSPPISTVWPGNNTDVVKLTASTSGTVMGPNMILKVMAGDVISSSVNYYYISNTSTGGSTNLLNNVVGSLVNALDGSKASSLGKSQSGGVGNVLSSNIDLSSFLDQHNAAGTAPKAYLNIVFLDEQFKFIEGDPVTPVVGSNFVRVSMENMPDAGMLLQQKAPKNGWAFVFLSNESNEPVYFDNLSVVQEHGRIVEENHYYPFGQKIGGISSKAFNKLGNKYNYQGEFAENEEETGWDEFDLRTYDAQIGRWTGVDPYDEFASPYLGMANNPVNYIDKDGGLSVPYLAMTTLIGATVGYLTADKDKKLEGALIGSGIGLGVGILSNMILNRYMNYADPEHYAMDAVNKYSDGFERYYVEWKNDRYLYRSFDAWINDKLADLFSNNYHFLGYDRGPKHSWIAIDQLTSKMIEVQTQEIYKDDKRRYWRQTYKPDYVERQYNFRRIGDRMRAEILYPGSSSVNILSNSEHKETLDINRRRSKIYKTKNKLFTIRYNTGYKTEYYDTPLENLPEVKVTSSTIITIKIRVKNNKTF